MMIDAVKESRRLRRNMIRGMRKRRLLNLKRAIQNADDDVRSLSKTWADYQTDRNYQLLKREQAYRDSLVAKFYEVKQAGGIW